jgi:polygalacturonase
MDRVGRAARPVVEELERRYLLNAPPLPNITGSTILITSAPYDAVGDGTTDNTAAIQAAINAASLAGGGTVEVPAAAGAFECGVINMANNVNLQIDSGAELQALASIENTASAWINVANVNNWEITGLGSGGSMGKLDGHSAGTVGTLNMIKISGGTIGLIQNVTVDNSPHEHIQCGTQINNNITINGVTINSSTTAANTDGIDPAGLNWLIENCSITDGDDNIAVKPQQQVCANITIQNCTLGDGHGISIGGQTNDGLTNMTVNNITFNGTTNGLRLKADRGNGGLVSNVSYSNITMSNVQFPILIDSYYNQSNDFPTNPFSDTGSAVNSLTPIWNNISFTNVTSTNAPSNGVAAAIYGLPEAPINNISFTNVNLTAPTGIQMAHVRNMTFDTASHITVTSGNDLIGTTSSSYPHPVDSQITEVGYSNADLGSPTVPFDTSESLFDPDTDNWTIDGGGAGVTGTSDQFNYTSEGLANNGSMQAEVTALTAGWAGVMYRASTNANDPFAAVFQSSSQIIFEYRASAGAAVQSVAISGAVGSDILQVTRSVNVFAGYFSTNGGANFTQIGSNVQISGMSSTANVGLAATSNSNGSVGSASFSNVQFASDLNLTTPATSTNVTEGNTFTVDWTGGNSADTVQIWAEGGPTKTGTELTSVPQTNGSYAWNTTGVDHGWYYIEAIDVPASGPAYAVQSPDWVHIVNSGAAAPNISVTNPTSSNDSVAQGNNYTVNFSASDGSGDTNPITVQMWSFSSNTGVWSELPSAGSIPASQGDYIWNTTGVAPGWYSFAAHATDGDQWSYASSAGWVNVTVSAPTISFLTPTSSQSVTAGGTFNLNWNITGLSSADLSNSTVEIWSQNMVSGSPVLNEIAPSVAASAGTYAWSVPTTPGSGTYYAFSIWVKDGDMTFTQTSPNWLQVTAAG